MISRQWLLAVSFLLSGTLIKGGELNLPKLAAQIKPSVGLVVVYDASGTEIATGSGFFVSANQFVTNNHVVDGATSVKIKMEGGTVWDSLGVLASDSGKDIAILFVNASKATPLTLSKANSVEPGTHISVIGSPLGLEGTVSDGIVSGSRPTSNGPLLQITAPISHGSSGSPVLDDNGQVVGVASMMLEGGQSLNFAISSSTVQGMLSMITPKTPYGKYPNSAADQGVQLTRDPSYQQAMSLMNQGDYTGALQIFKTLLKTYPKAAEIYYQLGYIFDRARMWDESIEAYNQSMRLNPDSPSIWEEMGKTLIRAGNSKEAIKALKHAALLAPNDPQILDSLGCAYDKSEDYENAAVSYLQALTFTPGRSSARLYGLSFHAISKLGKQQDASGQYSEAIKSFKLSIRVCEKAKELFPKWSEPVTQLAVNYSLIALTLEQTGDAQTAETWMQNALRAAPADPQVLGNAVKYYHKRGDANRYQQALNSLTAVNPVYASTLENTLRNH